VEDKLKEILSISQEQKAKVEAIEAKNKEIQGLLEKCQTKSEFEGINQKFDGDLKKLTEELKALNERADKVELKFNKQGVEEKKSHFEFLRNSFTEKKNEIASMKQSKSGLSFSGMNDMLYKLDDMTGANSTQSGTIIAPQFLPGINADPFRKRRVRELIAQGVTTSNMINYVQEYAKTANTNMTAEGAEWKQEDFDLIGKTANVEMITNYMVLSQIMLDDIDGLISYIMASLPEKIKNKEDYQLLYGDGNTPNITGVTTLAAVAVDYLADDKVQRWDVLAQAIAQATFLEYEPTAILVNKVDAMRMKLVKDTTGRYINDWLFSSTPLSIDGVPVIATNAITSGDFLVGDFRLGAQVFDRRSTMIEMSNTNEDNFVKGMVTVRGSERIAQAIKNPNAFVYGTFSAMLAKGSA